MRNLLIALQVLLAATVFVPVYNDVGDLFRRGGRKTPAVGILNLAGGQVPYWSVLASGVPAFLALLNLLFLFGLRPRWSAFSSLVIGLLSAGLSAQLLARYGYGHEWGGWAIWGLSMALLIAGTVACAGLRAGPCPHCGELVEAERPALP